MHCLYFIYARKDTATVAVISTCPKGIRLGDRGYYLATRRYEISLRVLKNMSQVSVANK